MVLYMYITHTILPPDYVARMVHRTQALILFNNDVTSEMVNTKVALYKASAGSVLHNRHA